MVDTSCQSRGSSGRSGLKTGFCPHAELFALVAGGGHDDDVLLDGGVADGGTERGLIDGLRQR